MVAAACPEMAGSDQASSVCVLACRKTEVGVCWLPLGRERGTGHERLQVDGGHHGKLRHQRRGAEVAGGGRSGHRSDLDPLVTAGDRSVVGRL